MPVFTNYCDVEITKEITAEDIESDRVSQQRAQTADIGGERRKNQLSMKDDYLNIYTHQTTEKHETMGDIFSNQAIAQQPAAKIKVRPANLNAGGGIMIERMQSQ